MSQSEAVLPHHEAVRDVWKHFWLGGGNPINEILHSILTQWTTTQNNEEEKAEEEERWGYFLLKRQ